MLSSLSRSASVLRRASRTGSRVGTAVARTDAKVVPVDEHRFLFLVQQTPNFALHVMRVLSDRLRRMDQRLGGGQPSKSLKGKRFSSSKPGIELRLFYA